jgi:hypothetical protein
MGFGVPGLDCFNCLGNVVGTVVTDFNSSDIAKPMCQANHVLVGSTRLHAVQKCHKDISEVLLHSSTVERIIAIVGKYWEYLRIHIIHDTLKQIESPPVLEL